MNDQLDGGDGDDFLIAYRSSTLIGGNGADVFNLSVNGVGIGLPESISTIKDFQDGTDRLKLPQIPIDPLTVPGSQVIAPPGTNVTNFMIGPVTNGRPAAFEELTILQQGANTEIRFGNDILAVLEGIQASQITPEDFIPADSLVGAVNTTLGVAAQDELSLAASRNSEIARQEYGQLGHSALNASNNFIDLEDAYSLGARAGLTAELFPLIEDFNDYSGLQAAVDSYGSFDSSAVYLG